MKAFSGANIYVMYVYYSGLPGTFGASPLIQFYSLDLTLPSNGSINRDAPTWTTNLLDSYISTIDAFLKYDNVLAYNIGNEIVTSANETTAAPFIKAAARDTKAYLSVHRIPISYHNADTSLVLFKKFQGVFRSCWLCQHRRC
jgi:Glucanosyltransferase